MNMLSYPRKFFVVGGLSLLSFLIVLLVLTFHLRDTITTAQQQLQGLEQVRNVSTLIQLIQLHRWSSASELAGQSEKTIDKESVNQQLNDLFATTHQTLPKELRLDKSWSLVTSRWRYLNVRNRTLGLNDSFQSHTRLIKRMLAFQRNLADYYQLTIVSDNQSHYIINNLLDQLPATLELLGQIRALGESYIVNKNAPTLELIKLRLTEVRIPLLMIKEDISKFEEVTTADGRALDALVSEFVLAVEEHLRMVKDVLLEEKAAISPKAFFQLSTKLIDRGYYLINEPLTSALHNLLDKRVSEAKTQLVQTMSVTLSLFLVVLYFSVSVYFSTIRSVSALTRATEKFHHGNFDSRVQLATNDELNEIAISFNDMAEAFQKLILDKEEINTKIRAIVDNSPIGIWFSDINNNYYLVNKTFCNLIGVTEEQFLNADAKTLPELLGPTVARHCIETNRAALNQGSPHVSYETAVDVSGEKHLLEVTKVQLHNAAGEIIGLIGISQDITMRRRQEDELRLANMVYQHSSEAMMIVDQDNKIIATNPAFTEITGYTEEELIGNDPKIMKSGKQSQEFYQEMWQELTLTGSWSGEIWNVRKDGTELAEWLSISTIYNDHGKVYRRIALFSDITEQKKNAELILRQANYDSLTQLPNRSMFNDRLEQEIKKSQRSKLPLALIFLDLDHFKEINDTQGHDSGDVLLVQAAQRITQCVRESDTVARLGGDEFTVILSELSSTHDVEAVCDKILDSLSKPFEIHDNRVYISASLGVTLYPEDATNVLELLKNADQAMYLSKKSGRNRYRYFTPRMQQEAQNRQSLLHDLRQALKLEQLEVYYQPIVSLSSNEIHKAEALIRWNHPTRGLVSPAEFIPLAEDSGLIVEIGDWVFKQVVQQVQRCQLACGRTIQISVNKSPVQFRETSNHIDWFEYLESHELSGEHIVVEITEGLLMDDEPYILKQLHDFRDANIEVSMDDFGTGYSSLSYLKKFHIDYLKIDQSFVRNLSPDSDDMVLSEAIIVMAHKLGLRVIAEGIETEQQMRLLKQSGCDYGQGYYFAKPLPQQQFMDLLTKQDEFDILVDQIGSESKSSQQGKITQD